MIAIMCPKCGKKVIWDDFQPMDIKCPKCRQDLNLRASFKENIRVREMGPDKDVCRCPHCKNIVPRRWFIKCSECGYLLFGPASFSGKWPFVLGVATVYILFTIYYLVFILWK